MRHDDFNKHINNITKNTARVAIVSLVLIIAEQ